MEEAFFSAAPHMPLIISFLAGMLTFISPCVLPLIPAYLSYVSGLSVSSMKDSQSLTWRQKLHILKASLMFVAGFSVVFILLGASMAQLVGNIFMYDWVKWIAGGIIIIFGLHIMHVITLPFLNYQVRAEFGDANKCEAQGRWKRIACAFAPFLLGLSFALGWSPCIGPIFAAIVSMAAQEETKGMLLMTVYTAGLGIPFILSALLVSSAIGFMNKIKRYFLIIERVAGGLLVLIGVGIITGGLGKITGWILDATM